MTDETKRPAVPSAAKQKKTSWTIWFVLIASALGALATMADRGSPPSGKPSSMQFENRYEQKRAANIACAGKWGEEREKCHARFGD